MVVRDLEDQREYLKLLADVAAATTVRPNRFERYGLGKSHAARHAKREVLVLAVAVEVLEGVPERHGVVGKLRLGQQLIRGPVVAARFLGQLLPALDFVGVLAVPVDQFFIAFPMISMRSPRNIFVS